MPAGWVFVAEGIEADGLPDLLVDGLLDVELHAAHDLPCDMEVDAGLCACAVLGFEEGEYGAEDGACDASFVVFEQFEGELDG